MDFLELAKKRYSAREYSPKEVEQEKLEYILECARLAPSAVNHQPWHFIVVKSDEARKAVQQCYPREWFAQAPLTLSPMQRLPRHGCGDAMPKTMPTSIRPSPWSTFVWQPPNWDWAAVGFAISMCRNSKTASICALTNIR